MQRYHVFRVWVREMFFVFLASGLITSIAVILKLQDGKPVPDWGDYISFNALLAILSTVLRAALVVTSSQIISQRKWGWYREQGPRPLSDLQQFEAGSRGALGALRLLPTIVRGDAVALAAIVVLLASFLIGPFVQQASRTEERLFALAGTNASLPFAHYVPRQGGFVIDNHGSNDGVPAQDLVAAILSAVTATSGIENQIRATCATGNCKFSSDDLKGTKNRTHSTVGMCSKCIDVSPLAVFTDQGTIGLQNAPKDYNITRIGGSHGAIIKGTRDLAWLGNLFTPDFREISRWAYVNSTFLASAKGNDSRVIAAVCSLYPCLRTYVASIDDNRLSESEIRSDVMRVAVSRDNHPSNETGEPPYGHADGLLNARYHYTAVKYPCPAEDGLMTNISQNMSSRPGGMTDLDLWDYTDYGGPGSYHPIKQSIAAPEKCIYRQNARFAQAVSKLFKEDVFNGRLLVSPSGLQYHRDSGPNSGSGSGGHGILESAGVGGVLRQLCNNGDMSFTITERWFDAFANAMTNRFRFQYGAAAFDSPNPKIPSGNVRGIDEASSTLPSGEVLGMTLQTSICVSFRGEWLLLPVFLTGITALLTAWTVATSWRHRYTRPVWKDSILPLIFCGHLIERGTPFGTTPRHTADTEGVVPASCRHRPLANNNVDIGVGHREGGAIGHDIALDGNNGELTYRNGLLEASEMKALGARMPVTFRWPANDEMGGTGLEEGSFEKAAWATPLVRQRKVWPRRRGQNRQDVDMDSLLETDR
ncbi:uncharacterized protein PG998_005835 [Apiospora kogelbergensis]|uniref:uncharacterized protein n=1 Tax=Apiospora kogelbergensis TaxID=1337665 RepID=UPI0031310F23